MIEKKENYMSIYLKKTIYTSTQFSNFDFSSTGTYLKDVIKDVDTYAIMSCPPGEHDLNLCATYEKECRQWAPSLIQQITNKKMCFVWALGPMDWGGLPDIYTYAIVGDSRYHIPEITFLDNSGYATHWLAFEFQVDMFEQMMKDDNITFDPTILFFLIFENQDIQPIITKPFWELDLTWIIEQKAIALISATHFEGFYCLTSKKLMNECINIIQTSFCNSGPLYRTYMV